MSGENTATFHSRPTGRLALGAVAPAVLVEDQPAPWLELIEVVRQAGPRLNRARFRVVGRGWGPVGRFEDIATTARPGQAVCAGIICPGQAGSTAPVFWPVFRGMIASGQAILGEGAERVELEAWEEMAFRHGQAIDGVRVLRPGGGSVYVGAKEVVFNLNGEGNCSAELLEHQGRRYRVFDLLTEQAVPWTYGAAVQYLTSEYLDLGGLDAPSLASWEALTEGRVLRDVEVTGLTPLEAIDRLCRRAGLYFWSECVPAGGGQVRTVLRFGRRGRGRVLSIQHQRAGEALDLTRTNVWECHLRRQHRTTLRVVGHGGIQRFEATFDLVQGWDPALEANNYDLYSPDTNADFVVVREVFRKWVLNEAGDYSEPPFQQGPAYDLSKVFGSERYGRRRRRFYACLSRGPSGRSLGYHLEASYDGGEIWQGYAGAFDVLLDECGVYLSGRQLDVALWYAIKKGLLRFRMTATVEADEPLRAEVYDGPVEAIRPVQTAVLDLGREFKCERVTPLSVFYGGAGRPRDDTSALRGALQDELTRLRQRQQTGRVVLPWVRPDVQPGDIVEGLAGRGVAFREPGGRSDGLPQINKVTLTWADQWTTTIEFGEIS